MTVGELKDRLSVKEFHDWEAFYLLEPFLPERVDIAGALVSSTLANVNRGKNQKAFSMSDFMVVSNGLAASEPQAANANDAEDQHMIRTLLAFGGFGP